MNYYLILVIWAREIFRMFPILAYNLDLQNTGCSNPQMDTAGTLPMFRTALGKSVPLKESSITKALSILGADGMIGSGV